MYATAMQVRPSTPTGREWLAWIQGYADRLDPPTKIPGPPEPAAVREWDLQRYLTLWPSDRPWRWTPGTDTE
jgi:hypothetical protein